MLVGDAITAILLPLRSCPAYMIVTGWRPNGPRLRFRPCCPLRRALADSFPANAVEDSTSRIFAL